MNNTKTYAHLATSPAEALVLWKKLKEEDEFPCSWKLIPDQLWEFHGWDKPPTITHNLARADWPLSRFMELTLVTTR